MRRVCSTREVALLLGKGRGHRTFLRGTTYVGRGSSMRASPCPNRSVLSTLGYSPTKRIPMSTFDRQARQTCARILKQRSIVSLHLLSRVSCTNMPFLVCGRPILRLFHAQQSYGSRLRTGRHPRPETAVHPERGTKLTLLFEALLRTSKGTQGADWGA